MKKLDEVFLEIAVSAARAAGAVIRQGLGTLGSHDIDAKQAALTPRISLPNLNSTIRAGRTPDSWREWG